MAPDGTAPEGPAPEDTAPGEGAGPVETGLRFPGPVGPLPAPLTTLLDRCATTTAQDLLPDLPGRVVLPPVGTGGARAAAVLLLLSPGDGAGPDVVVVERAGGRGVHAGQVAFPGGGVDPEDASTAAAALREAREESGLDPAGVQLLGAWPALPVPVSRYVVTPVLAWEAVPSALAPGDPGEIAAVRRIPLAVLASPEHRVSIRHRTPRGGTATTPAFAVDDLLVWGFTGMLLDALLRLSDLARPWDRTAVVELPARWAGPVR